MTTSAVFTQAQPFTQQSSGLYHQLASTPMQYGKPGPETSAGSFPRSTDPVIRKDGANDPFTTVMARSLDDRLTVIVLTNLGVTAPSPSGLRKIFAVIYQPASKVPASVKKKWKRNRALCCGPSDGGIPGMNAARRDRNRDLNLPAGLLRDQLVHPAMRNQCVG